MGGGVVVVGGDVVVVGGDVVVVGGVVVVVGGDVVVVGGDVVVVGTSQVSNRIWLLDMVTDPLVASAAPWIEAPVPSVMLAEAMMVPSR